MENRSVGFRISKFLRDHPWLLLCLLLFVVGLVAVAVVFVLNAQSDPPGPCGSGHRLGDYCYWLTEETTFAKGTELCRQDYQAEPASIHSDKENEALHELFTNISRNVEPWIAMYYEYPWEPEWKWVDGTGNGYQNFARATPFDPWILARCAIFRSDAKWDSTSSCKPKCPKCEKGLHKRPVLCKKPALTNRFF